MVNKLDVFEEELQKVKGVSEKERISLCKIVSSINDEKYVVLESLGMSDEEVESVVECALS